MLALRAGEAARKQGDDAFERFHLALLDAHHLERKEINQPEVLEEVARAVNLDVDQFRSDLKSRESLQKIAEDYSEARERYGVFGTPTIVSDKGNAVFLKMMPPPSPDEAIGVFDSFFNVISDKLYIEELKRTEPSCEDSVYEFLIVHGFEVQRQVALDGFAVNMAILHPETPGRYLLGIVCDNSLASGDSRLQESGSEVQLYHISPADWNQNRGETEDRLLDAIRNATLK